MPTQQFQLKKLECSRRQLESAIELFFDNGDCVSIHTLTCAAYNIIRDVNKNRGGTPMFAKQRFIELNGKLTLRDVNEPENFFKHADKDSEGELTFCPQFTECLLVDACEKYSELTDEKVPGFLVFTLWFMSQSPEDFDIPDGWESFAKDARSLHQANDRQGFYQLLSSHISEIKARSRDGDSKNGSA